MSDAERPNSDRGDQLPPSTIPLGLRWVFWLQHIPRRFHQPIGCLVVLAILVFAPIYLVGLLGIVSMGLVYGTSWALGWASANTENQIVGVACLVTTAAIFYSVRSRWQLLYGWIEFAFAICGMWLGLQDGAPSRAGSLSLVMGSVYVLIRAFDNIAKGKRNNDDKQRPMLRAAAPEIAIRLAGLDKGSR